MSNKCIYRAEQQYGRYRSIAVMLMTDSTVRTVNMHCQSSVSALLTNILEMTLNTPLCVITENRVLSESKSGKSFHVN
jgi:hypothetical protein